MKKHFLVKLLCSVMLTLILTVLCVSPVSAETTVATGSCGTNVTWAFYDDGRLVISGTGDMADFTSANTFTNSIKRNITSIEIGSGITKIGNYAFYDCNHVTEITIPESVTQIGDSSFYACSMLRNAVLGSGITSIGNSAFSATSLQRLSIPDQVQSIGDYAFAETHLKELHIGTGVTTIGQSAFRWGYNDEQMNLYLSKELNSASIGQYAFADRNLHSVYYDGTATQWNSLKIQIGSCGSVEFQRDGGTCGTGLNWRFYSDGTLLISGTGNMTNWDTENDKDPPWDRKTLKRIVICDGVTSVGNEAFMCYEPGSRISEAILPPSVTRIGDYAFAGSNGIGNLDLSHVTYFGEDSFYSAGLTGSFMLHTSFGMGAFSNNSGITEIKLIGGTQIGVNVFANCNGLKTIHLPSSLTYVNDNAFFSCGSLSDVYFAGSHNQWEKITIVSPQLTNLRLTNATKHFGAFDVTFAANGGTGSMAAQVVPADTATALTANAFTRDGYEFTGWNTESIPTEQNHGVAYSDKASVTLTGDTTLYAQWRSTSPTIVANGTCGAQGGNLTWMLDEDGVLTISGTGPMQDCVGNDPWLDYRDAILSVVIEPGVTSIGDDAFVNCLNLSNVTIPEGVLTIGDRAFAACAKMTKVILPSTVTSFGSAFGGCSGLTEFTIPDGVTVIGSYAFRDCSGLTQIEIPANVTSIGSYAFCRSGLTGISIPSNVSLIDYGAFCDCSSLESLTVNADNPYYISADNVIFSKTGEKLIACAGGKNGEYCIPENVKAIESCAFLGCSALTSVVIPEGVTEIGYYIFGGCSDLKSVTIPASVESIERYSFDLCNELKDVYFNGSTVQWNGIGVEEDNIALTNATIHYGAYAVTFNANGGRGEMAALSITKGSSANLTASAFTREGYLFTGWNTVAAPTQQNPGIAYENMAEVTPTEDLTLFAQWGIARSGICGKQGNNLVWELDENGALIISGRGEMQDYSSYTAVPWYKLRGNITSLELGSEVTSIGNYAFYECSGITCVTIPEGSSGTWVVGKYSFYNCANLTSITVPFTMARIGENAFSGCNSLTDVYYYGLQMMWFGSITIEENNDPLNNAARHCATRVNFESNGGAGDMAEQWIAPATTGTLTANSFTRNGYSFVGWNTIADPTLDNPGTAYEDKASVTSVADLVLYAQWSVNPATILSAQNIVSDDILSGQVIINCEAGTNYTAFAARYDENGRFLGVEIMSLIPGQQNTFSVPYSGATSLRFFVLDTDSSTPACESAEVNKTEPAVPSDSVVFPLTAIRQSATLHNVDGIEPYGAYWFDGGNAINADLSDDAGVAYSLTIGDQTTFNGALPAGYDAAALIEWGMYPGLNVDILHQYGFTGAGAVIAYVDQPISDHSQYSNLNLHYTNNTESEDSMHGPAVLSLLAGKDIGIAPDAEVYYFAHASWQTDQTTHAECLYQIIEQNEKLSDAEKIRMVGFSDNIDPSEQNAEALEAAVAACEDAGIMVWFCGENGAMSFVPFSDKNSIQSLMPNRWGGGSPALVYVPAGGRTTAATLGNSNFIYWSDGGLSWTMPYTLGLYAIAVQIDPTLTQDALRQMIVETAYTNDAGQKIVNPVSFVAKALQDVGRSEEAQALLNAVKARTSYFYAVMDTASLSEEDLTSIGNYLASITDTTVLIADTAQLADAQAVYTVLQADAAERGGTVAGVQIFGTPSMVPSFQIGYKVQMPESVDEGGTLLTDLFYGNFENKAELLTADYNVLDHMANGWEIDLVPQWPVTRLPLGKGEFPAFFQKYNDFVLQTGLERQTLVNFSSPIFASDDHVDNMGRFLQRMDSEFGIMGTYRLYGNQKGQFPLDDVLGDFSTQNLAAENELGIAEFLINSHGQWNNIDGVFFENGQEQRESLVNMNTINSVLNENPYYLDAWTCSNGYAMQNNLTTTALNGNCVGMFSATAVISNNGVNWQASLDEMQRSNFFYFYYNYLRALNEGQTRSQAFFEGQRSYAQALLADSERPLRGEANYQFNLYNLLAYHNFGVIEPNPAVMALAVPKGYITQAPESIEKPTGQGGQGGGESSGIRVTDGAADGAAIALDYGTSNTMEDGIVPTILSYTAQRLNNGYTRFTLTYTISQETGLSVFNPPQGSLFMMIGRSSVVDEGGVLVFDLSSEELSAVEGITVKFFAQNASFFVFVSTAQLS